MPPIPDGPIKAQLKTLDKDKPTIVTLLLKLHNKHLRLPEFSPPDSEGESYNTFPGKFLYRSRSASKLSSAFPFLRFLLIYDMRKTSARIFPSFV